MELRREVISYLEELKVVHAGSLQDLPPVLGIDAEVWISDLLQDDFNSQLIGGVHLTLRSRLVYHLQKLKDRHITPLLLFPGISPQAETSLIAKRHKKSNRVWEELSKAHAIELESILAKQNPITFENLREIIEIARENGAEVMVCPSLVGFQMESLEKVLGGVMGGVDLMAFGIGRVVLDVDYEAGTYRYVVSAEAFRALEVNLKKFRECCIVKGFWLGRKFTKHTVTDILLQLKSKEITKIVEESHAVAIDKAVSLIDSPVFLHADQPKLNFRPNPLLPNMPTKRSHEKFYFAMSFFPLSVYLATAFIKKVEVMSNPTSDSLKFRTLIHKYKPIMKKIYSTLNKCFEEGNIPRGIKVYYWYDEVQPFQLDFEQVKLLNWDVYLGRIEEEKKSSPDLKIDLQFCINWHISLWSTEKSSLGDTLSVPSARPIALSPLTLKLKVYLRLLEVYKFITEAGIPTLFGKAVSLAKPEFQYEIFIMVELLRLGLLDWKPMTSIWLPELLLKSAPTDAEDLIRLVSRVSTLVPPSVNGDVWTGAFDHDLAQFYSITRHIAVTYQYLQEAFILEEFVNDTIGVSRETINAVFACAGRLPLQNIAVGMLVKKVMSGTGVLEAAKELPQINDPRGDLEKAWIFWKEFLNVVKILTNSGDGAWNILIDASKLFKTALISAGIHIN